MFFTAHVFFFEIFDKATGENVFQSGDYQRSDVRVVNTLTNKTVTFKFIEENDLNRIVIQSVGWETETVNLELSIDREPIFEFYVDAVRIDKGCSHTEYNEITLKNVEYEHDLNTGVYKIFIDID